MTGNRYIYCVLAMALIALQGCKKTAHVDEEQSMANADSVSTEIYVDTLRLQEQTFHRQLICNGKLRAIEKCDLSFADGGVIEQVYVHNGERVSKGQVIARTDRSDARLNLEKATRELENAQVSLADKLIGLGYDGISANVPAAIMHRAKVTSGYYLAQYQLQAAKRSLGKCTLLAPFAGRITDLVNKRHQRVDKLCGLVNDGQLDVEFEVLEAEIKHLSVGQRVWVSLFVDDAARYGGRVVNINPMVSDKGLIKVTARIANDKGLLMDGMNVKVIAENDVKKALVVPKDAVIERDGYHVVFMYKDGEAVWTYVDVPYANIGYYAITGCERKGTQVQAGDVVITSGNLNLADGTQVHVKKK